MQNPACMDQDSQLLRVYESESKTPSNPKVSPAPFVASQSLSPCLFVLLSAHQDPPKLIINAQYSISHCKKDNEMVSLSPQNNEQSVVAQSLTRQGSRVFLFQNSITSPP